MKKEASEKYEISDKEIRKKYEVREKWIKAKCRNINLFHRSSGRQCTGTSKHLLKKNLLSHRMPGGKNPRQMGRVYKLFEDDRKDYNVMKHNLLATYHKREDLGRNIKDKSGKATGLDIMSVEFLEALGNYRVD